MDLKVCDYCGCKLNNIFHYKLTIDSKDKNKYSTNIGYIDLCPSCYEKLIKDVEQFKYGEDKNAEVPSEGVLTQNFISRDEFLALQALFLKYSKNKRKLAKLFDYFLYTIDTRVSHEATEEEMNNIVSIATKWEKECL